MDIRRKKIANWFITLSFVLGSGVSLYREMNLQIYFMRIILSFFSIIILYKMKAVGAGDIKLLVIEAGFLGLYRFFICLVVTFVFAGIFSLYYVLKNHLLFYFINHFIETIQCLIHYRKKQIKDSIHYSSNTICFSICILCAYIYCCIFNLI